MRCAHCGQALTRARGLLVDVRTGDWWCRANPSNGGDAAPHEETRPPEYDLVLESSGSGWMGTFALAVAYVAQDILSDGEPFKARVTWESDDGCLNTQAVTVTEVRDGELVFETVNDFVAIENIRKLEV